MDYSDNLSYLSQYAGDQAYLAAVAGNPTEFMTQIPAFIGSAELRILRDLDLLATRVTDATGLLTPNSRLMSLPTDLGSWQVVETVALIDVRGIRRSPLTYVSKEVIDALYPDEHAIGDPSVPTTWAPYSASAILVGPAPSAVWSVSVYGVQYPASMNVFGPPIQPANPLGTTFISVNLPDLMLAAEMIDVSAWLKNFGAMSDNPQLARDWNQEYERILAAARPWELRRKLQASGWSSRLPNPVANAPAPARAA